MGYQVSRTCASPPDGGLCFFIGRLQRVTTAMWQGYNSSTTLQVFRHSREAGGEGGDPFFQTPWSELFYTTKQGKNIPVGAKKKRVYVAFARNSRSRIFVQQLSSTCLHSVPVGRLVAPDIKKGVSIFWRCVNQKVATN